MQDSNPLEFLPMLFKRNNTHIKGYLFVCLFICLLVFPPLHNLPNPYLIHYYLYQYSFLVKYLKF